ncbi:hypothetical protein LZQ00_11410 [Sphingobacterium sp. SRCM116780]|nr:hypothetical protein [Sphingobacterium sp. SRCM116780]UIR54886.1 hypothetical protein LZQ00_11410 [Sphingobacterium sp. SRCM116780]
MENTDHTDLITFLQRIPGIKSNIGFGDYNKGLWWVEWWASRFYIMAH